MQRFRNAIRSGRGLPSYAFAVIAIMVVVILWGAVVRATGSGNGCGDHWPLCNGEWVPQHPRLTTLIEFTHRSTSGICTAVVAVLIAWTFLAQPRGNLARRAAVWTGILLVTEALLGALLVLGHFTEHNTSNLRVLVQGIHLSNTMLLLGAMTLAWWWQRPRPAMAVWDRPLRRVALLAMLASILAAATGSVAALADTLFPSPSLLEGLRADLSSAAPLLVRMRWVHPVSALLAAVLALWMAARLRGTARSVLVSLIGLQIVLGVADVLLLAPVSLQMLHLLGADAFWIALVAIGSEALRGGTAARQGVEGAAAIHASSLHAL